VTVMVVTSEPVGYAEPILESVGPHAYVGASHAHVT
jgi:hypothetical protein